MRMVWVEGLAGRFMFDVLLWDALAKVALEMAVCGGRFSGLMKGSHERCREVESDVVSLGRFLCSEVAGGVMWL